MLLRNLRARFAKLSRGAGSLVFAVAVAGVSRCVAAIFDGSLRQGRLVMIIVRLVIGKLLLDRSTVGVRAGTDGN